LRNGLRTKELFIHIVTSQEGVALEFWKLRKTQQAPGQLLTSAIKVFNRRMYAWLIYSRLRIKSQTMFARKKTKEPDWLKQILRKVEILISMRSCPDARFQHQSPPAFCATSATNIALR
jgi:hypothetical protein